MPFKKGQSGNPKGRPPHPYNVLLTEALEAEGKRLKLPPMKRIAKLFYADDTAALKVLRTLVPELKNIETKIDTNSPYRLILEYAPTAKTHKTDKQGKQRPVNDISKPVTPSSVMPKVRQCSVPGGHTWQPDDVIQNGWRCKWCKKVAAGSYDGSKPPKTDKPESKTRPGSRIHSR